ncbi:hypothetical protein KY285_020261 [Solanum tuberosum]|nr:hypothetical protein KY289_020501 [Solanum tuberosum]KAH0693164.1 hypothetical protein KY285_020261 [Solanum tuberosum]
MFYICEVVKLVISERVRLVVDKLFRVESAAEMAKKRGSSFAVRLNAFVGHGVGLGINHGHSHGTCYPDRARTRVNATSQPEDANRDQPQVVPEERVQEHVFHDAPSKGPPIVPIVSLLDDVVIRLLNVLEALVPNQDPHSGSHSVAATGQPKDLNNFMDLKPSEFDATPTSIEPQKFIDHCVKILNTLGLKETRGVKFTTFMFSVSLEAWWTYIQRGRQAVLPLITLSKFFSNV